MSLYPAVSHAARVYRVSGCSCAHAATGAVERANPLPVGRYWVDVFAPDSPAFQSWLASNAATVNVVSTQHFDANAGGPSRDWVLFQVTAPTSWNGPGFPTIADASVTSSADTASRPDPTPDMSTTLEQGVEQLGSVAASSGKWIGIGVGVALVFLLARKGGR